MSTPMTLPPMPMGPEVHKVLQRLLDDARTQLGDRERDLDAVVAEMSTIDAMADDEHDPDGSPRSLQRTLAAALVARARADVAMAEDALRRYSDGSYGRCDLCGRVIPPARLSALPTATTCVGCASASAHGPLSTPPRPRRP